MPGIRNLPHDLRRHALDKIAALSASSARDQARSSDFVKLCDVVSPSFSTLKLQNSGQDVPPSTKIPLVSLMLTKPPVLSPDVLAYLI